MSFMKWIGMVPSAKPADTSQWPGGPERYYGLENFGNTCYCNSILQALYHCPSFRDCVLNYPQHLLDPPSGSGAAGSNKYQPTNNPESALPPATTSHQQNVATQPNPVFSRSRPPFRRLSFRGQPPNAANLTEPKLTRSTSNYADSSSLTTPSEAGVESFILPPHMTATSIGVDDSMFTALKDLFYALSTQKKRTGIYSPNSFIQKLRKENELFRGTMHQDAHEFLNYILNAIVEDVTKIHNQISSRRGSASSASKGPRQSVDSKSSHSSDSHPNSPQGSLHSSTASDDYKTWLHTLFEGILTNETKCLTCETVSSREESFLDLSIDIEDHSSVTSCLRQFSASEILCQKNKFYCDECGGLQEAEKRMKVQKLPNILALHLKRFKYQERLGRYVKLSCRVLFPFELRLPNTTDQSDNPDRLYSLFAICIHIGGGPYHGHYVSVVKSHDQWILFDDDSVELIEEDDIQKYFGDHPRAGSGYLLFYQANDLDPSALDLPHFAYPSPAESAVSVADYSSANPPPFHRAKTDLPAMSGDTRFASTTMPNGQKLSSSPSSKRSSSLFVHRSDDMGDVDPQKLRSPSLNPDGAALPAPTGYFDLPPDMPARIPPTFPSFLSSGLAPPLATTQGYRAASTDSPMSPPPPLGGLSIHSPAVPWHSTNGGPRPAPTSPLPPLPRSPSRAHVKGDHGLAVASPNIPSPVEVPLAHRSRQTHTDLAGGPAASNISNAAATHMVGGGLNLGSGPAVSNGRLSEGHSGGPMFTDHLFNGVNNITAPYINPLSRPQSPGYPIDQGGQPNPMVSKASTLPLPVPIPTPESASLPTVSSSSSLAATISNPSSWFTRRDSQPGKTKESMSSKFWKPMGSTKR
ncbi:hypothetical protein H4R33_003230 [Dimargaris cristalligena]|nr:hypothetical protein H4R33_003230 [Dimargaris cristalligena]